MTDTKITRTLAATAALGFGLAGLAAQADMAALDGDGDGLVTYTELLIAMPDLTEGDFAMLDVDESGALDDIEYTAATDAGLLPAE